MTARAQATRPRRRGFTLLEMTIAGIMLAVAMSLTVQILAWSAVERRSSDRRLRALQEVSNLLERLAATPWDGLTAERARAIALPEPTRRALPGAELQVAVDPVAGNPDARRLQVALRWHDRPDRFARPVRLVAFVHRRNPEGRRIQP